MISLLFSYSKVGGEHWGKDKIKNISFLPKLIASDHPKIVPIKKRERWLQQVVGGW